MPQYMCLSGRGQCNAKTVSPHWPDWLFSKNPHDDHPLSRGAAELLFPSHARGIPYLSVYTLFVPTWCILGGHGSCCLICAP